MRDKIQIADVVVSTNHVVFLANRFPRLISLLTSAIFVSRASGITAILKYRSVNPINWNKMRHDCRTRNNFIQNLADHCVYMKQNERIIIISWINDQIIAEDKVISLGNVKKMLMSEFKMKDLGELNYFIRIDFDITQRCVKMNQKRHKKGVGKIWYVKLQTKNNTVRTKDESQ